MLFRSKKYRHIGKEYDKVYQQRKADVLDFTADTKDKLDDTADKLKQSYDELKLKAQQRNKTKLEVKAEPVEDDDSFFSDISSKIKEKASDIKNAIFKKESNELDYPELIKIEIKKKKKNNLYGEFQTNQPELRDYN